MFLNLYDVEGTAGSIVTGLDIPSWDTLADAGDQNIKITTSDKKRVIPEKWMKKMMVAAASEDPNHPASNMVDGRYETIFSAGYIPLP